MTGGFVRYNDKAPGFLRKSISSNGTENKWVG